MASWNTEATTTARDASIMRTHVIRKWGDWPLSKIDHLAVQTWITDLGKHLSPATVAECRRLTSGVLRSAVRNRLIAHNPSDGVRVPRRRRSDTDDQVIARSVLRNQLLPVVPVQHRAVVAIAAGAGLHWGEAIGVCADVLDLGRRVVHVRRTVIEVAGHTSFKPFPKSDAGRRSVPLPGWVVSLLREHLDAYPLGPAGMVFTNAAGGALRRTLFRSRVWRPSLVRAGLLGAVRRSGDQWEATWTNVHVEQHTQAARTEPQAVSLVARGQHGGLRFHDLRHPYVTWLVDDGVPPNMVQKVTGHEKSATTLDLYTRRTDDPTRILRALDDDDPDDLGGVPTPA